ncbi:ABC transporter ATP-binding protein [Knoellia sp. p5-6-4]|uniref:ABC transporter ATP-binding protein n=1 Tax=unclassified Knoellia TaxID=2618719 RepID=UPI0023DBA82C|nr:ABC transporter ATP-binding protein [Knoellia sp. p5-6-4]MDF2144333.1 ABC transporter ATP-binding protein [Knoellia sp. p5-6-4]
MTGTSIVRTHGLTKHYGRTLALRDLDLEVERGEVFGYLGPNGAGKTTTLRLLMGLLRPTSGSAEIDGLDSWRQSVDVRRRVGYLSGEPALYGKLTGAQHVDYLGHLRGEDGTAAAGRYAARLDLDLTRPARELSKGNRQKLALVLALMSQPTLLVLDEPTGGLDPLAQQEFYAILHEHTADGRSVLLSSHVLSEVQRVADRVGVLREGRLIAVDRLANLRERSLHHIRATFADDVEQGDFAGLPGLRDLKVDDHSFSCSAPESALDAVIKEVGRHTVLDFECAEAELEETFLAYYEKEAVHAP